MQRLVILALLFSIFLVGCSQPEEKKVLCPAENYKLLGKDFKEPGWVVGDADSSGFEIMFKEWKQILLTRASCSYQGVAVKATKDAGGFYFIYVYPSKEIADGNLAALKKKIEEQYSTEQAGASGFRFMTPFGTFTFVRYSNAIIGAGGTDEEKVIEAVLNKIRSS